MLQKLCTIQTLWKVKKHHFDMQQQVCNILAFNMPFATLILTYSLYMILTQLLTCLKTVTL